LAAFAFHDNQTTVGTSSKSSFPTFIFKRKYDLITSVITTRVAAMNASRNLSGLLIAATVSAGAQAVNISPKPASNNSSAEWASAQVVDHFPWELPLEPLAPFSNEHVAALKLDRGLTHAPTMPETHTTLMNQPPAKREVSEPASELLMLAALGAAAIAIRRQSPY
jgi:hypothetical protein